MVHSRDVLITPIGEQQYLVKGETQIIQAMPIMKQSLEARANNRMLQSITVMPAVEQAGSGFATKSPATAPLVEHKLNMRGMETHFGFLFEVKVLGKKT